MTHKRLTLKPGLKLLLLLMALSLSSCGLLPDRLTGEQAEPTSAALALGSARLNEITGDVLVRRPGETQFTKAESAATLPVKSQIKTLENSHAVLELPSGSLVRLWPKTELTLHILQDGSAGPFTRLWLDVGSVFIKLNNGTLEVESPLGLAAVRGSLMRASYTPNVQWMIANCLEGFCSLQNSLGRVEMLAGEASDILGPGLAPRARRMDGAEVQGWLWAFPEATLAIPGLTATVAALPSFTPIPSDTPPHTATPEATATLSAAEAATLTATFQPSPTGTRTLTPLPPPAITLLRSAECRTGPGSQYPLVGTLPKGWSLSVVGRGVDGSWIVPWPSQPRIACWVSASAASPNQSAWFVPVYAAPPLPTKATTPTKTPEPPKTNTPVIPTSTPTVTLFPTANTPPQISNPAGPSGAIGACSNAFSVNAVDNDGIDWVKVQYAINDAGFSLPRYAGSLPQTTGSTYAGSLVLSGTTNGDTVYWRFVARDNLGMVSFSYSSSYTDSVGCP